MEKIALGDRVLPLRVHVNPRAHRLILRIENGGRGVRLTVPPGTAPRQIAEFIEKIRHPLKKKLEKFPSPYLERPMLRAGAKIPYLGHAHVIVHQSGRGITHLCVTSEGEKQIIVQGDAQHLPRRIRDFFKQQAQATIAPLVASYAAQLGKNPSKISYKDTKSRWGSCSHSGALSFSWRIIMAPLPVVNYFIAHEVAHLAEMNHGQKFWEICTKLYPQTQSCRAWLKRNGQVLHAIEFE